MGMIEEVFEGIKGCPFCKSKGIQAIVTRKAVFYKDKNEYWQDEGQILLDEEEIDFICMKCEKGFKQNLTKSY